MRMPMRSETLDDHRLKFKLQCLSTSAVKVTEDLVRAKLHGNQFRGTCSSSLSVISPVSNCA